VDFCVRTKVSNTKVKPTLFSEIGLATAKDGFIAGIVVAIILELGIIKIEGIQQAVAIWLLLVVALYLTYHHLVHHQSLISPPLDGFVIGFGWVFGILNVVSTIPH